MHVDVRFKDYAMGSHGVSLIILTYNTLDLTKICIESILRYPDVLYEIILVDNASKVRGIFVIEEKMMKWIIVFFARQLPVHVY